MARLFRDTSSDLFVGRSHELGEIRQVLDRAVRGSGGVLLVAGEPGIGKTRLVEEAVDRHPGPVAWGTCVAGHAAPAFRPWTGVLRRWADERTLAAAGSAAGDVRRLADGRHDGHAPADASRIRHLVRLRAGATGAVERLNVARCLGSPIASPDLAPPGGTPDGRRNEMSTSLTSDRRTQWRPTRTTSSGSVFQAGLSAS